MPRWRINPTGREELGWEGCGMTDLFANGKGQQHRDVEIGLAFECRVCGKPIILVAESGFVVVPDRELFLRVHGACLEHERLRQLEEPP